MEKMTLPFSRSIKSSHQGTKLFRVTFIGGTKLFCVTFIGPKKIKLSFYFIIRAVHTHITYHTTRISFKTPPKKIRSTLLRRIRLKSGKNSPQH